MGLYVDHNFVRANGTEVSRNQFVTHTPGADEKVGVAVIDNRAFYAAGVAYSPDEAKVFADEGSHDPRARKYFLVSLKALEEQEPEAYKILTKGSGGYHLQP